MNTIGNYNIPKHVTDQNSLEILIENMKKIDTEKQQTKPPKTDFYIKMSFLLLVQEESNKHFNSIKFIYEQLNLVIHNKLDYPTEMIIYFFHCYLTAPLKGTDC